MSIFLLAPGDLLKVANDSAVDIKAAAGELSVSLAGASAVKLVQGAVAPLQARATALVLALTQARVEFPEAARVVYTLWRSGELPARGEA